jgi:hypothetical protein
VIAIITHLKSVLSIFFSNDFSKLSRTVDMKSVDQDIFKTYSNSRFAGGMNPMMMMDFMRSGGLFGIN